MTSPRDPTQFTRESAERIANVVRAAELAATPARPLVFERVETLKSAKAFRIANFTGSWGINTQKVVSIQSSGETPTTVAAQNLFFPLTPGPPSGLSVPCAIAKDGTAWYLVDVPLKVDVATVIEEYVIDDVITNVRTRDIDVVTNVVFSNCSLSQTKESVVAEVLKDKITDAVIVTATATAAFIMFDVGGA